MRIVSEWKDYDLEVKKLQKKVNRNQTDEEEGDLKSGESTVWRAGEWNPLTFLVFYGLIL